MALIVAISRIGSARSSRPADLMQRQQPDAAALQCIGTRGRPHHAPAPSRRPRRVSGMSLWLRYKLHRSTEQRDEHGGQQGKRGQRQQRRREALRRVPYPADEIGADETAQVPGGDDQGDPACRRASDQERRRDGLECCLEGIGARDGKGEGEQRIERRREEAARVETKPGQQAARGDVPDALARAVRSARPSTMPIPPTTPTPALTKPIAVVLRAIPFMICGSQKLIPNRPTIEQKLIKASNNTEGFDSACPSVSVPCPASMEDRSRLRAAVSTAFSRLSSHGAFSGVSIRMKRHMTPSTTARPPSTRNSHCQPFRPPAWCMPSSAEANGPPPTVETGIPTRKAASALARQRAGTQPVR